MVTHDIAELRARAADTTLSIAARESAVEVVRAFEYSMSLYSRPKLTVGQLGERAMGEIIATLGPLPGNGEG